MGNTPSISEKVLVPEWFDRLVQPDFHGRIRSRKFLDSLRKRVNSKNDSYRWSHAGLTYCLTQSEIEILTNTLRDYQLGVAISNEDNSTMARAMKSQRCQEALTLTTTAVPSFQKDFEYRIAILRTLQGPLRKLRGDDVEKFNEAVTRKETTWGKTNPLCIPESSTSYMAFKVLSTIFRTMPKEMYKILLNNNPAMDELSKWISKLPPLSLFKEWSPRPVGDLAMRNNNSCNNSDKSSKSHKSDSINFVTILNDMAMFAYELSTTSGNDHDGTRSCGRKMLSGLAFASGKLCVMLRLLQALIYEGNAVLSEAEQKEMQKLLKRLSLINPITEPWLLPKTKTNVVAKNERWRMNLSFGHFVQLQLTGIQMGKPLLTSPMEYCKGQITSTTKDGQFLHVLVYFNNLPKNVKKKF